MPQKFHDNAVITSYVNKYCLVCETSFESTDLALQHIEKPAHRYNKYCFKYIDDYEDDRIRLVPSGYYCEFCNILTNTGQYKLHATTTAHHEKRKKKSCQKIDGTVVAFNKVAINPTAWHGLMDGKCFICDTVYEDARVHQKEDSHLFKLVQSKVELIEDGVFRRKENETLQCVTCNIELATSNIQEHLKCSEHKMNYAKYQVSVHDIYEMVEKSYQIKRFTESKFLNETSDITSRQGLNALRNPYAPNLITDIEPYMNRNITDGRTMLYAQCRRSEENINQINEKPDQIKELTGSKTVSDTVTLEPLNATDFNNDITSNVMLDVMNKDFKNEHKMLYAQCRTSHENINQIDKQTDHIKELTECDPADSITLEALNATEIISDIALNVTLDVEPNENKDVQYDEYEKADQIKESTESADSDKMEAMSATDLNSDIASNIILDVEPNMNKDIQYDEDEKADQIKESTKSEYADTNTMEAMNATDLNSDIASNIMLDFEPNMNRDFKYDEDNKGDQIKESTESADSDKMEAKNATDLNSDIALNVTLDVEPNMNKDFKYDEDNKADQIKESTESVDSDKMETKNATDLNSDIALNVIVKVDPNMNKDFKYDEDNKAYQIKESTESVDSDKMEAKNATDLNSDIALNVNVKVDPNMIKDFKYDEDNKADQIKESTESVDSDKMEAKNTTDLNSDIALNVIVNVDPNMNRDFKYNEDNQADQIKELTESKPADSDTMEAMNGTDLNSDSASYVTSDIDPNENNSLDSDDEDADLALFGESIIAFCERSDGLNSNESEGENVSTNSQQFDNNASNDSVSASNAEFQNDQEWTSSNESTNFDRAFNFRSLRNNNDNYVYKNNCQMDYRYNGGKQDAGQPSFIIHMDDQGIANVNRTYREAKQIFTGSNIYASAYDTATSFGNRHQIINFKSSKAYCTMCKENVMFTIPDMQWHVLTRRHRLQRARRDQHDVALYTSGIVPAREVIPFRMASTDFLWQTTFTQGYSYVILNLTYCLTYESYNLYYNASAIEKVCLVCEDRVPFIDLRDHVAGTHGKHRIIINLSQVVTELRDEFVREVLPNKFHCGFCNLLMPSFRDLLDHLRGYDHRDKKLAAYLRLNQMAPHSGHDEAIVAITEGNTFRPNWAERPNPGDY